MDFKKINIMTEGYAHDLEDIWRRDYREDSLEEDFIPYRENILKLNFIVGFGRGFWAGVDSYYYIVYHEINDKFYWFTKNEESDKDIYFHELKEDDKIFSLLESTPIGRNFKAYDKALDYGKLFKYSRGESVEGVEAEKLENLFGSYPSDFENILMELNPASKSAEYPHSAFDKSYLSPMLKESSSKKADELNLKEKKVFSDKGKLFIQIGNEVYSLKKANKK